MKISDIRAHHIRIPYDAGVASFRQGAASIAALDIVMLELTTDSGLTGWGDAFSYVCPRTTHAAIDEMIAPQARGQQVPDAAGIPAFMEQILRGVKHQLQKTLLEEVKQYRSVPIPHHGKIRLMYDFHE